MCGWMSKNSSVCRRRWEKKYKKWLSRVRIRDFSFDFNFSLFSCKQDDNEEDWHERKIRCSAEEKSFAFFEGRKWKKGRQGRLRRSSLRENLDGVIIKWFIILQTINHMKRAKGLLKSLKECKHSSLSASMQAEREKKEKKMLKNDDDSTRVLEFKVERKCSHFPASSRWKACKVCQDDDDFWIFFLENFHVKRALTETSKSTNPKKAH